MQKSIGSIRFVLVYGICFSILCLLSANAQRPVRNTIFYEKTKSNQHEQKTEGEAPAKLKRFSDTITIAEQGEKKVKSSPRKIEMDVDEAMKLFDNQEYALAQEKFIQLSGTITTGDPLLMDVLFMSAECDAVLGNYRDAEKQLVKLTTRADITSSVLEKALVRLGHVFCAQQKTGEATQAFKRLKAEFPDSKYSKLADCSAIK